VHILGELDKYLQLIAAEPAASKAMVLSGLLGFFGAAVMFAGDLLLYAHWGEMPVVDEAILSLLPGRKAVLLATSGQLQISGVLGPIAAVFYLFGAWHLYIKLAFYSRFWAALTVVSFAFSIIIAGAYHALWGMYGFVVQFANEQGLASLALLEAAANYMNFVADTVTVPLGLACLIILVRTLLAKTDYPRWMALLNPLLLLFVGGPILDSVAINMAVPYGALTVGTYFNVVMMIFFLTSVYSPKRKS
tara:strand:- start:637 stop:1380 length:744 start_codon:yes stop_codon:yes gene_type:complete